MDKYINKSIKIDRKITYQRIINLCISERNYCLYENRNEISLGTGKYLELCITGNLIKIISDAGIKEEIKINDFCTDLETALDTIDLQDWRLYGIANFSLARYTYGLDSGKENETLLHLFIPKREYRFNGNEVILKAFTDEEITEMEKKLQEAVTLEQELPHNEKNVFLSSEAVVDYDEKYYKQIVRMGVDEITRGDYQKVILSRKIPVDNKLDMKKTFIAGRKANTPARAYMCRMGDLEVVGFSPETVAEVDRDGTVYTFPLAGTRALTVNPEENRRLREELLHDTKEIAEHAVSVKLAEEELQQICEKDSVVVTEFMSVMERGTVQHLGSRLRGKLKQEFNSWHVLCKLFPAVTASGIPKKEAIDAIGRIEKDSRELYSGSVLISDKDGYLDAALVLRSIFQDENNTWIRVGAGIVEMSNPEREFMETQEKVRSVASSLVTI